MTLEKLFELAKLLAPEGAAVDVEEHRSTWQRDRFEVYANCFRGDDAPGEGTFERSTYGGETPIEALAAFDAALDKLPPVKEETKEEEPTAAPDQPTA